MEVTQRVESVQRAEWVRLAARSVQVAAGSVQLEVSLEAALSVECLPAWSPKWRAAGPVRSEPQDQLVAPVRLAAPSPGW